METINQNVFNCSYCYSKYPRKSSLERHVKTKHEGRKFSCKYCNQQFNYQCAATKHEKKVHHGLKEEHLCNLCDFKAFTKGQLKQHRDKI